MSKNDADDIEVMEKDDEQVDEQEEQKDTGSSQDEGSNKGSDTDAGEEIDWKAEALKYKAILDRQKNKKSQPAPTQTQNPTSNQADYLTREEGILIAQGMDEESLNEVKAIAKGKGITLLQAKDDPVFKAYYEQKQEALRKEKAKLGASRGSGQHKKETVRPGMTREEHKDLWKQKVG